MKIKENKFYKAILPVFSFLNKLEKNLIPNAEVLRETCTQAVLEFEEVGGRNLQEINDVQYAIYALIDEKILNGKDEFKSFWAGNSLQLDKYGAHIGGEEFFERLFDIEKSTAPDKEHILYIYYLCLDLGFMGRYRHENKRELESIKFNLKKRFYVSSDNNNDQEKKESQSKDKILNGAFKIGLVASILMYTLLVLISSSNDVL
ncbi:MAG: DotU family type IV/VI secretion system protein [Gammaproteobacteria bacterium]